jgi:hypothetical protein
MGMQSLLCLPLKEAIGSKKGCPDLGLQEVHRSAEELHVMLGHMGSMVFIAYSEIPKISPEI